MNAQLIGVLAAASQGGDETDLQTGAWVATNSTQYNYLLHEEIEQMVAERKACPTATCANDVNERFATLDEARNSGIAQACDADPKGCQSVLNRLIADEPANLALVERLRKSGEFSDAAVIGFVVGQSNDQAKMALASLLSQDSAFEIAFAGTLLGMAAGGGARPGQGVGGAKGDVAGILPKPGATSIPESGVGGGAAFKVDPKQLGKKLGKHVEGFGGNATNPADRKMVLDKIHDIGRNPEKLIPGTFAGQGPNGARGDVYFRVKGNDVIVTKPDGTFVTMLKDGVTQNPSVQNALKGGVW